MIVGGVPLLLKKKAAGGSNIPSDYIAFWTMDSYDGTTIFDESDNSYDLTISGASTGVSGYIGEAVSFDGSNDYLEGSNTDFDFERDEPFSISFWLQFDAVPSAFKYIAGNEDTPSSSPAGWSIRNAGSGLREKLAFQLVADGSGNLFMYTSDDVLTDSYRHYCVTYNGSSQSSGIKIYVDGESKTLSSNGTSSISGSTVDSNSEFSIGLRAPDGSGPIDGDVDQFRIYDRVLTQEEITLLADEA